MAGCFLLAPCVCLKTTQDTGPSGPTGTQGEGKRAILFPG